jgi:translation initiation factor IF-3
MALHRVFIAPIEQSNLRFAQRISPSKITSPSLLLSQQRRSYAAPSERRLPHDDLIKSWSVILVKEDGTLSEPRSKADILETMGRAVNTLIQVAPGEPGMPPICKIMNKRAVRDAEKVKAKAARSGAVTTKTLELNWAIDMGDLGYRLERAKQFLGKGYKVEVVLASKRKGKQATPEEAQALIDKSMTMVGEVDGAKEVKPMEGKLLGTATIYLGKVQQ